MSKNEIYLDYAATAPLRDEAAEAMQQYLLDTAAYPAYNANPNSLHTPGRNAFTHLENARKSISTLLGCRPHECIFTGCATESNNAALFGVIAASRKPGMPLPHIVTSSTEHDALRQAAQRFAAMGLAEVSFVDPLPSGHIDPVSVSSAIRPETVLVSIIAGNNETGALNDIEALGKAAHEAGVLFHTDAVQILGKVPLQLSKLPIDLASFAAHKIGGPKGVGLLYLKSGTPFLPYMSGGGQENGKRSGTQNVCGIAGFAAALEASYKNADMLAQEAKRLATLRDKLYSQLESLEGIHQTVPCTAGSTDYLPHIVNVYIDNVESETLILQFDLAGIAVSGGSACSTHSLDPSPSLLKLGLTRDQALGSLRISIGMHTTEEEIDIFLAICKDILSRI